MAKKKILENPVLAGMVVPLAVVLVAAFIIFGITKMLTPQRDHIQLVRELEAKRFGNRWIAAYELSKLIATSKIPIEEQPRLIKDLSRLYDSSPDLRTKKFLLMAASALKSPEKLELIYKASQDTEREIRFHAIVALANADKNLQPDLSTLKKILNDPESNDPGLLQAALLGLSHHGTDEAITGIRKQLHHPNFKVQMAAASGLINFKDEYALERISQILLGSESYFKEHGVTAVEANAVKVNMLEAIGRVQWKELKQLVVKVKENEEDIKVLAKASEILSGFAHF